MSLVAIHKRDVIDPKTKLATINLDFKSIYGSERLAFANLEAQLTNQQNQLNVISNQISVLNNLTRNLNSAAINIIQIDGNYYFYHYGNFNRYNSIAKDYYDETGYNYQRGSSNDNNTCRQCDECVSCETGY